MKNEDVVRGKETQIRGKALFEDRTKRCTSGEVWSLATVAWSDEIAVNAVCWECNSYGGLGLPPLAMLETVNYMGARNAGIEHPKTTNMVSSMSWHDVDEIVSGSHFSNVVKHSCSDLGRTA